MASHHISSAPEYQSLLSSTKYVVVDFTASWCGPCNAVAPLYEDLAKKHSEPKYLAFAKVDVDAVAPVATQYGVRAIPTFMFFQDGKQVAVNGQAAIRGADVARLTGAAEKLAKLAGEKKALAA